MVGPTETPARPPGLRERKKQQTRETIEHVALKLFAVRGYEQTTLAEIAEAADVSPRTIFSYFDGKEDILFCDEAGHVEHIKEILDRRPEGATTVDALRDFIASLPEPDELTMLRKEILGASPELQMRLRAHVGELEDVLADSIARDLSAQPGDIRPALIAASMTAAFMDIRDRFSAAKPDHGEGMRIVDEVLEFLQGGLRALQSG
jgi:AcrR family transcriptional regulator